MKCPRCAMRGLHADDGLTSCLYCGEVVRDDVSLFDKWASNSKNEIDPITREHFTDRLAPAEAPADVKARVIAAIRREAANAS